jgi:ABC-type Fe3+/spermidine/putrescine transport system ATPase subunit
MIEPGHTILCAHQLHKEYGHAAALVRAVDDVSLTVTKGESVAIVGPSGCGKSTLLYLLGGLERPTAGTIELASPMTRAWPPPRTGSSRCATARSWTRPG